MLFPAFDERLSRLKADLSYGGLSREEFARLRPAIYAENRSNMKIYTLFCFLMFGGLSAADCLFAGLTISANLPGHLVCCAFGGVSCLLLRNADRFRGYSIQVLCRLLMTVLFGYSVYATVQHPVLPAATCFVLLVLFPMIFVERPVLMAHLTICYVAIFCIFSYLMKSRTIFRVDIEDAVLFGILAIQVDCSMMKIRIKALWHRLQIEYLNTYDVLTGLKNRNSFERYLAGETDLDCQSLCCLYADVNGLHERNNTLGHEAGDRMLQAVAHTLHNRFGEECYRVGGDEFVAFLPDTTLTALQDKLRAVTAELQSQGYEVAFGCAEQTPYRHEPDTLVKAAEARMFAAKRSFYQSHADKSSERVR